MPGSRVPSRLRFGPLRRRIFFSFFSGIVGVVAAADVAFAYSYVDPGAPGCEADILNDYGWMDMDMDMGRAARRSLRREYAVINYIYVFQNINLLI